MTALEDIELAIRRVLAEMKGEPVGWTCGLAKLADELAKMGRKDGE